MADDDEIYVDVVPRLDESASDRASSALKKDFADAGKSINASLKNAGRGAFDDLRRNGLNSFSIIADSVRTTSQQISDLGQTTGRSFDSVRSGGARAAATLDSIGAAAQRVEGSIHKAFADFKSGEITKGINTTAEALRGLGQGGAADNLTKISGITSQLSNDFGKAAAGVEAFKTSGNGLGGMATKIGGIASVILVAIDALERGSRFVSNWFDKRPYVAPPTVSSPGVPGSPSGLGGLYDIPASQGGLAPEPGTPGAPTPKAPLGIGHGFRVTPGPASKGWLAPPSGAASVPQFGGPHGAGPGGLPGPGGGSVGGSGYQGRGAPPPVTIAGMSPSARDDFQQAVSAGIEDQFGADLSMDGSLPGLARFAAGALANLAFAPAFGALSAVKQTGLQMSGGAAAGGSGLAGIFGTLGGGGVPGGQFGAAAAAGLPGGSIAAAGGAPTPYGLAKGTNISAGGSGFPSWVYDLGRMFNIQASTYGGHQEGAGVNQGIDWTGSTADLQRFAEWATGAKPPGLQQVIWQNPQTGQRLGLTPGGQVVTQGGGYYRDDWGGHQDHVHTRFGASPFGFSTGGGGSGFGVPGIPGMAGAPSGFGPQLGPGGLTTPAPVGRMPGSDAPASQGIGISGGLLGALTNSIPSAIGFATAAGSMGANAGAPGAGAGVSAAGQVLQQFAQIGIDMGNRTAAYIGQLGGIAASGAMETFMLSDTGLADPTNTLLGRIALGIAGARPQLPNIAGQVGQAVAGGTQGQGGDQQGGLLDPNAMNQQGQSDRPWVNIENQNINSGTDANSNNRQMAREMKSAEASAGAGGGRGGG
ncbi:hypothetical protein [Mycobacterium marinum]|uniref:hypothetical protein n=1 Tax=Mycobacterium marinum TaxID=1781 RepID=UPI002358EF77|nr:hypothetical protein [Mycobacterium marinum]MDC8981251.1 hypothetical protein [Mycobacterium marinum]